MSVFFQTNKIGVQIEKKEVKP